jgi:hypothetical protein
LPQGEQLHDNAIFVDPRRNQLHQHQKKMQGVLDGPWAQCSTDTS